jgi:flagellin
MANTDLSRIAGNIGALNALNSLNTINKHLATHQARLASGKAINSAADDPAGLTIATKMLARSEGLKTAQNNIGDAQNMLSVAEGGLSKMNDILVVMRSKAEQAASDTLGTTERQAIQTQLSSYAQQIQDIVDQTKWNSVQLLNGNVTKLFQTGADSGDTTTWTMSQAFDPTTLGISTKVGSDTANLTDGASGAIASTTNVANFSGLSKLQTGSYQVSVKTVAATAAIGKVVANSGSNLTVASGTIALTASNNTGAEITNGGHTVSVVSYNTGTGALQYSIDGGATANATLVSGSAVALGTSGLSLNISDSTQALTGSISFDYVQHNMAKMALQTADGQAVATDVDGIAGGSTGTYFYATAGAAFNSGTGLSMMAGTLAALQAQENTGVAKVTWTAQNNFSVNVSTASLASNYMNTINSAMDTVNSNLASLGSLEARLDFKSEQTSTAQANVEASYNRIMNADMAQEQVEASKYSILQQVATAMLAQANAAPQNLLTLFR